MPNKLSQFWQDLKRRNVVRVMTVYTGAAFVILSLVDMIREPFELPNWSFKLVIVILSIGLIIAVILSWIYDIHPEGGMVKTETADQAGVENPVGSSKGWKIASYISFVVILGLIALNIFGGRKGPRIDESLEKSIAVLVFQNLSGDDSYEYICVGLTGEIINNLNKMASFDQVRTLTSVRAIQDPELSIKEIAQKLLVNYVLEGSYTKMGDQLEITVRLIEARHDNSIWDDDYEIPYGKIMGIPGDIAKQIANNLEAFISEDVEQSIDRMPTDKIEAYECLQQAKYLFQTQLYTNPSDIVELIEKAIELDPNYADAYALAGGYFLATGSFAGNKGMQSAAINSLPYLIRAIEIDPMNSSVHLNLGTLYLWYFWDYIRAEEEYLKALKLEPNNPLYIGFYLEFLNKMNRPGEVIKLQKIPGAFYSDLAKTQLLLGNNEVAKSMIQVYKDSLGGGGFPWIGECYLWMEEYELAINHFEIALNYEEQSMKSHRFQSCLAIAYHFTHREQQAQEILIKMRHAASISKAGSPDFWIGYIYSGIGEIDSAFYYLEKAYQNRSSEMPWLKSDPIFNSLRHDPKYKDLYERTGHKAYDDYLASKK